MEKSNRYRVYSDHLIKMFGEKVYKIPLNLPGTCPNRDGNISYGGCIFCDEQGSGFECLDQTMSIKAQNEDNIKFYTKKFNAHKYIVYLQTFSNTYLPLDDFKKYIIAAIDNNNIVGLSISTRPDCINDQYLSFLSQLKKQHDLLIDIELGLQTVNYRTLDKLNRGHSLAEFIDAALRIKGYNLNICAHLILNLPWDDDRDAIECAKILSALKVDYVKIHSLYIVEGTKLGDMYLNKQFEIISLQQYIQRVILFLRYLSPDIVIQRLFGKGPKGQQLFCNWNTSWWLIKEKIEEQLDIQDINQGDLCSYLDGQVLNKFNN